MAQKYRARVYEFWSGTGTGDIALAGRPDSTWQTFAGAGYTNGETTDVIIHGAGDFESCSVTYNSGPNTLTRGTIKESSNGGARVNFGSGLKTVLVVIPAKRVETVFGNITEFFKVLGLTVLRSMTFRDADLTIGSTDGTFASNSDDKIPTEKAVKTYVDAVAVNVGKRQRVRAATTANITIATALNNADSLDGVTLATGDLVLVKNQSAAEQNGIYVVGVSPARAGDFDTYNEHSGSLIAVEEGTSNADTLWLCTSNDGGTLNTTAISFSQVRFSAASDTLSGIVELATDAETETGTDTARAVTPTNAAAVYPKKTLLTTRGDLFRRGASAPERLPVGATNTVVGFDGTDTIFRTLTAILDAVAGSTRGMLLYRGAASWGALTLGASGKFLKSDGTDSVWDNVPGGGDMLASNNLSDLANIITARTNLGVDKATLSKSAGYTVIAADYGALIKCTSSFTLAFTAAATLGDKFKFFVRNDGTGLITFDPNGSETVDGATTKILYPGDACEVFCDGSNFKTVGKTLDSATFSTAGYVTFAGGLIVQFGIDSSGASDNNQVFSVTFPTACVGVIGVPIALDGTSTVAYTCHVSGISTSGFSMRKRSISGAAGPVGNVGNAYWFALGY
jgi:hypothetical protein